MDPLSIVASVIAISQAGDSLIQLLQRFRLYFNVFDHIEALVDELCHLRLILDTVHMAAANLPGRYVAGLAKSLDACKLIILELETILTESSKTKSTLKSQLHRVRWVKKKNKVESLRVRLRDSKSTITLHLLAINPAILCQSMITNEAICETPSVFRDDNIETHSCVQSIAKNCAEVMPDPFAVRKSEGLEYAQQHTAREVLGGDSKEFFGSLFQFPIPSGQGNLSAVPSRRLSEASHMSEPSQYESIAEAKPLMITTRRNTFPLCQVDKRSISMSSAETHQLPVAGMIGSVVSRFESMFCGEACKCSCHRRSSRQLHLLNGHLGSLLISCTGRPFQPKECGHRSCIKRCPPRLLLVLYIRLWFTLAVVSLTFSNVGRLHMVMSFPRVMPPGSEFFVCIRAGHCERMRQLLEAGTASVADIVAPYGLTPLALAIMYEHVDACRLLIEAGGQLLSPNYTWSREDLWRYIAYFSPVKSSYTAGAMLQDEVRWCLPQSQRKTMHSCIIQQGFERDSYTRLHKCILGLTSESAEIIGQLSKLFIDETDSIGRTALHWAAYMGSVQNIDVLLRCGANPNSTDYTSTTPLHAAAGLGSVACVDALINGGASMDPRDRFGATPLHYASAQGHMDVVEVLLDRGADCEAQNYFGETPISYAIFGRRTNVIRGFLDRTGALEYVDKWGFTPVLDAVFEDSHEALELLLQLDMTNTSGKLFDGKTLLHVAAINSDLKTIEILQNARLCGLDSTSVDIAGNTAMDYVRQRKDAADVVEPFGALLFSLRLRSPNHLEGIVLENLPSCEHDEKSMADVYNDALEYISAT